MTEQWNYRDRGCSLAPSCLACPLAVCRHDAPGARRQAERHERAQRAQVARGLMARGLSGDEAAEQMGVSRRTVFRLIGSLR